jgi:uncharacterized protein
VRITVTRLPRAPHETGPDENDRRSPIVSFFALAFAWSWASWWTAVALGFSVTEPPGSLLYLLGVFGPLAGAAWVVHHGGSTYRREFLRRIWDPRGISARWWLALLAVTAGPAALGAVGASLTGRAVLEPGLTAGAAFALMGPALVASLAEEPGWRGAVADAWQTRTRPVSAATGIGVIWSLWHLPLSFLEGSYYHELGAGSLRVWVTHLMLVQFGILLVWLANGAGGSILLAVLAHTGFNSAMGLVTGSTVRDLFALVGLTVAAMAVIFLTRGQLGFPTAADDRTAGPREDEPTRRDDDPRTEPGQTPPATHLT